MRSITQQQDRFLRFTDIIGPLSQKYEVQPEKITKWREELEDYRAFVPLIGCYSSGKSSLLNTLLGEKHLAVEINPTTDAAYEITYNDTEQGLLINQDNREPISFEAIKSNDFPHKPDTVVRLMLRHNMLARFRHIALVDLPGLQSGIEAHSRAIDSYIEKSVAYFLIVDPEILLRQDLINFLLELRAFEVPVYCIITKVDKKPAEQIQEVKSHLQQQILDAFEREADGIGVSSALHKNVDDFISFLATLEDRSGELMHSQFQGIFRELLDELKTTLEARIANADVDDAELLRMEHEIKLKGEQAIAQINRKAEQQQTVVQNTANDILQDVRSALEANASSLASSALNGSDINPQIQQIARTALTSGLKSKVEPILREYNKTLHGIIPQMDFHVSEIKIDAQDKKEDGKKGNFDLLPLITIPLPLPPIIKIVSVIVSLLSSLFGGSSSKSEGPDRQQQAEQQIRSQTIPQVISNLQGPLNDKLMEVTDIVTQQTQEAVQRQTENLEKSLEDIRTQRAKKQEEFERQKREWTEDLVQVRSCYELLS